MNPDPCHDCGNPMQVCGAVDEHWCRCTVCGAVSILQETALEAVKVHNMVPVARMFMALANWSWHACMGWLDESGHTSRVEWAGPPDDGILDLTDDITLGILLRRCTNDWARLGYRNWSFSYFDEQDIPGREQGMPEYCLLEVWEGTEDSKCFEGLEPGKVIYQAQAEALRRCKEKFGGYP